MTPAASTTTSLPAAVAPPAPTAAFEPSPQIPAQTALAVVDLQSGTRLFEQRADVLGRPTHPGSIAKVFTLIAAMKAGEVDESTRITCREKDVVGGRTLECSHPRFGRPLSAREALAHSCNSFFVAVAKRTTWPRIAGELRTAGLPSSPAPREPALGAVGIEGPEVAPAALLAAFARVVGRARHRHEVADRVLLGGLRDAAREGTARAFGDQGLDVLAKTGSGRIYGGAPGGLVVALYPAEAPRYGVVVIGAGIAGRDAAAIGAAALRRAVPGLAAAQAAPLGDTIRLGSVEDSGVRVSDVLLEDYVAGVVCAEAPPDAPPALREALAIAARSYARANDQRHAHEGFALCDLTHCQAYRRPDTASIHAARATAGLVVMVDGRVAPVFHSASCGGTLEAPGALWPAAAALDRVMPARPEPVAHDAGAWRVDVTAADLLRALRAARFRGDELRDLTILSRTSSGRVGELRLAGLTPDVADGETFRLAVGRTLGWQVLKSTHFAVTRTARGYRFDGRGRGHGVGLCVAGAERLAKQGQQAREILATYFPGGHVGPGIGGPAPSRVRVILPALDESERPGIEQLLESSLLGLQHRLAVARPDGLVIRFHPTGQSYVRAGGPGWWTGGVTRHRRIEFAPLAALRQRGVLERTVSHELVHALTADALASQPRWVNEGLATYLAEPEVGRQRDAGPCPGDEEFAGARTAASMAALYERSASCVARALASAHGDWRRAQWE